MIPFLLLLAVGVGQQPTCIIADGGVPVKYASGGCKHGRAVQPCSAVNQDLLCIDQQKDSMPAPLKCGKYEHIDYSCGNSIPGVLTRCIDFVGHCAPDLHTVTEKEWQHLEDAIRVDEQTIRELMARLKRLENPVYGKEMGSSLSYKELKRLWVNVCSDAPQSTVENKKPQP